MSTTLMTVPAEGWYPDPADAGHWRWWDGAAWTDHVQVKATEPITAPQTVATPHPVPAPQPVPAQPVAPQPVAAPQIVPEPTAPYAEWSALSAPPSPVPAAPEPQAPSADGVPQPGSVVAAPPSGPVSMTPTTPVSDQMYWHSSAAEVIEVPRHHSSAVVSSIGPGGRSGGSMPRYLVDWNDIGSPNTRGVWLLALSPILIPAIYFAGLMGLVSARVTDLTTVLATLITLLVVVYVFLWASAGADIRALRERGYRPPSIWWMLLFPPLAYLIARGRAVRRESRRAWPPELVYVLGYLLTTGAAYLSQAMLMASGLLPSGACVCP